MGQPLPSSAASRGVGEEARSFTPNTRDRDSRKVAKLRMRRWVALTGSRNSVVPNSWCRSSLGELYAGRSADSWLAEASGPERGSIPMPSWPEQDLATFLANLLLPAVCLYSAIRTFQINRGAAAGFFLQALGPLLETIPFGPHWQGARPPDHTWPCTVVGLPLLAFGFHWLNGDCFTANVLLGGALMLAGGWGYFTEEGKAMVVHSVVSVVTITIFIVSVFTGTAYGIMGSLLLGASGLLPGTGLWPLLAPKETDALRCLMAAANLALCRALQVQHLELGNSYREWLPVVAS